MNNVKNLHKVRLFLIAKTPEEAVVLQVKNNRINDTQFTYEPVWDGKRWILWFNADISKYKRI